MATLDEIYQEIQNLNALGEYAFISETVDGEVQPNLLLVRNEIENNADILSDVRHNTAKIYEEISANNSVSGEQIKDYTDTLTDLNALLSYNFVAMVIIIVLLMLRIGLSFGNAVFGKISHGRA